MFLAACAEPAYRRIALQDAPGVLGQARYRAIGESFYLAGLREGLALLTATGRYAVPPGDLPARHDPGRAGRGRARRRRGR